MKRVLVIGAIVLVGVAGVLLVRAGGDDPYTVQMRLDNAGGLRNGSPVVLGGVPIGTVRLEANQDDVEVKLDIKPEHAPLGKDATAAIIAQNVLGQKQVRILLGDRSDPAPEGYTLPSEQVSETTDLDQLLSAFDADTRTRLAILVNETGTAFAGRKLDFKTFLRDFAPSLSSFGNLLEELGRDNRALENLLATSDRYVGTLAHERKRFARMIKLVGQTTETVAARRGALREMLRRAPGALRSTRSFLAELRRTTGPLAATARLLTATAPPLTTTLERLEPFRRAAAPALATAARVAPDLTRLADRGTPIVRKAVPLLSSLKNISQQEVPRVGAALDDSTDNLFASIENWSRAIQFRDGLSHVFRGEGAFAPEVYQSIIDRLIGAPVKRQASRGRGRRAPADRPSAGAPQPPAPSAPPATPGPKPQPKLDESVQQLLDELLGPQPGHQVAPGGEDPDQLLEFLLGDR